MNGEEASELSIRPYRPGDEVAINEGFNEVFGMARDLAEWRWKFGRAAEHGRLLIAERDGELLAHFGTLVVPLEWRGKVLRLGQTVDCYARRRPGVVQSRIFEQLFWRLRELFGAELDGLFGFPGTRHMRLGQLRLGYAPARPVVVWRRSARGGAAHRQVTTELPNRAELDHLWARSQTRWGAAFHRDAAQLERRFGGRPRVVYEMLSARRWLGGLEGLAVTRVCDGVLVVAELVWDGRREVALERLDADLDALAHSRGAASLELWLSGDPLAESILAGLGWERGAHEHGLGATAVSFRDEIDPAELLGDLYVTMGDADLV